MYLQTYTVTNDIGASGFPLEMLAAERAFPMNPSDVLEIVASETEFLRSIRVQLGRYVYRKSDKPLCRRWESHGWAVIEGQTRRVS